MLKLNFDQSCRTSRPLLLLLVICLLTVGNISAKSPMLGSGGNALNFDGTNDIVSATVPALFGNLPANDFTFEVWVFPNSTTFSRIIYAQSDSTNFGNVSIGIDNRIYFYVVSAGSLFSSVTDAPITNNQWTHVAARWTAATNSTEIFFNGTLQPSTGGGSSSFGTNGLMTLGSRPGGFQYFNGTLEEVRVWNTARTQAEISSNMNVEILPEMNLITYYRFNQGVGGGNNAGVTTLTDSSASANNGTLSNFALNGNTSNWIGSTAPLLPPTAAMASVRGRVLDQNGRGIYGASVRLNNTDGEMFTARTNPFGYFSFPAVIVGETYILSAEHKTYSFDSQVINVFDNIDDLTFIANND